MADKKTKVKTGKGLEWTFSVWDDEGFLLGIHFDRRRKISKSQMDILKAALWDAIKFLDDAANIKRTRTNIELIGNAHHKGVKK